MGASLIASTVSGSVAQSLAQLLAQPLEQRRIVKICQSAGTGLGKHVTRTGTQGPDETCTVRCFNRQAGVFLQQRHMGAGLVVAVQSQCQRVGKS